MSGEGVRFLFPPETSVSVFLTSYLSFSLTLLPSFTLWFLYLRLFVLSLFLNVIDSFVQFLVSRDGCACVLPFEKISGYRVGLDRGYSSMESSLRRNYFVTWYVIDVVIDVSCLKKKRNESGRSIC